MARRSLRTSSEGICKAKKAFKAKLWTQEDLANEVGIETRQPIWKFFTGKPLARQTFIEICFKLDLEWQEIAAIPTESETIAKEETVDNCPDIDALVQMLRLRRQDKLQSHCATISLLDSAQPIALENIYVNADILEDITGQKWLNSLELQGFDSEIFERFYVSQVRQKRVPAIQAVTSFTKLMVLGKPGSGKTTLLQQLAMLCSHGKLLSDRIPFFIRLRNFAEDARESENFSLLNYISQELSFFGATDCQVKTLLRQGRVLLLLDGLDEIQSNDRIEILKTIRRFCEEYYRNQVIVTCRFASQQYQFEGFTSIEIADFNLSQIEEFVGKWFTFTDKNLRGKNSTRISQFMQKLHLSENWQIRELCMTPLLLHLICSIFEVQSEFIGRRTELYKQGLETLLIRWDEARNIKRDASYYDLSLPHKIKLLSHIASQTFEQGYYFFEQSNLQQLIMGYLHNSINGQTQPEELQLASEAVLKSLQIQHGVLVERARGIYSFSHLTFQEYLTARNIVDSPKPHILEEKLLHLVRHLTEPRWRNIFLLTVGMLSNADYLLELMKQHIDELVLLDEQLQQFLTWLNQKSLSVQAHYKFAAIRVFYLTLVTPDDMTAIRDLNLTLAIDPRLAGDLAPDLVVDLVLNRALSTSLALAQDPTLERVLALSFILNDDRVFDCNPELQSSLQKLKEQLPAPEQRREWLKEWWHTNGQTWAEQLRSLMLRYRNIGHQWQFSDQQKEALNLYYVAQQLLLACLRTSSNATPALQNKIEETLFLPSTRTSGFMSNRHIASFNVGANRKKEDTHLAQLNQGKLESLAWELNQLDSDRGGKYQSIF